MSVGASLAVRAGGWVMAGAGGKGGQEKARRSKRTALALEPRMMFDAAMVATAAEAAQDTLAQDNAFQTPFADLGGPADVAHDVVTIDGSAPPAPVPAATGPGPAHQPGSLTVTPDGADPVPTPAPSLSPNQLGSEAVTPDGSPPPVTEGALIQDQLGSLALTPEGEPAPGTGTDPFAKDQVGSLTLSPDGAEPPPPAPLAADQQGSLSVSNDDEAPIPAPQPALQQNQVGSETIGEDEGTPIPVTYSAIGPKDQIGADRLDGTGGEDRDGDGFPDWRQDMASPAAGTEIVFIDTAVANWQLLRDNVRPGMEVVLIDSSRDGIAQIAAALQGRTGISAVHIASHADAGAIHLGSVRLTLDNLSDHAARFQALRTSLTEDGDILFYGCDLAAAADGVTLLGRLAELTGADVAGSTDLTGNPDRGGDWVLEQRTGNVDAAGFLTEAGREAYAGVLTNTLSSASGWTPVMQFDPVNDTQANAADTDLVGSVAGTNQAARAVLYTRYDDNGTPNNTADDFLSFRVRIDNPTGPNSFTGVAVVGIDANRDGRVDLFLSIDGRNNAQAVRILDPGTGLNNSPSTTSTSPLPVGWLANNGTYPFSSTNYSVTPVSATSDPHWDGDADLGNDGKSDIFVSFRVPMADIAAVLAKPSLADRNGVVGPRGTTGIAGYTKDTPVQYVVMTQTQPGPLNGDLGGVGAGYNRDFTFAQLGAFTPVMSAANPVAVGQAVTVSGGIGDGNLSATDDDSVTLSGTTTGASSGAWVKVTVSDTDNTTPDIVFYTQTNGTGWQVANANLSALADGTLTVSAELWTTGDGTGTRVGGSTTGSATVLHDKTPPLLAVTSSSTAGTPTISGTSDLPAGSTVTVTIDPDNNANTANNVVYRAVVGAAGAWSVSTATTPVSGTVPAGGFTGTARVTATATDPAGNSSTATGLNRPTVTAQTTTNPRPTITGTWTNIAGDTLSVTVGGTTYTVGNGLTVTGDSWSLVPTSNLSFATHEVVATVTRGAGSITDATAGEVTISQGPAVTITGGATATGSNPWPTLSGTSTVINGLITVRLDPGNDGALSDAVTYSVTTDGSGNWTLNTLSGSRISGALPVGGYYNLTGILATASTAGGIGTAFQALTVTTPTLTSLAIETGISAGDTTARRITGDGILNRLEATNVTISGQSSAANGTFVDLVITDGSNNRITTSAQVSGGNWSATGLNLSGLDNGTLSVTATLRDTAVSASGTVTHDKAPPRLFITSPSVIARNNGTVSGSSLDLPIGTSLTIQFFAGTNPAANATAALTATTTVAADGTWTIASLGNIGSTGTFTLRISATNPATATPSPTDTAGNFVTAVDKVVTIDNGNKGASGSVTISTIAGDDIISATQGEIGSGLTISGTTNLSAPATVDLTVSDGTTTVTKTGITVTNGTWSSTLTLAEVQSLRNGTLTVLASASNASNEVTAFRLPTLSLPSPSLTITDDVTGVTDGPVTFTFTFTEGVSGFTAGDISVTNGTAGTFTQVSASTYTLVVTPTANSAGDIRVSVASGVATGTLTGRGNALATATQTFDTASGTVAAPTVTVNADLLATNARPTITGTTSLPNGASILVTIDPDNDSGTSNSVTYSATVSGGTWSVNTATAAPIGGTVPTTGFSPFARVTATGTNAYGNSTTATALNKPTVVSQVSSITTPTITGTWANITGDALSVQVNGVTYTTGNGLVVTGNAWSLTTPVLGQGTYEVVATATRGGNTNPDVTTGELVIDTAPPAIAITSPTITNITKPVLSGTTDLPDGTQLTITLDPDNNPATANSITYTVVANGGTWSVDTATALPTTGTLAAEGLSGLVGVTASGRDSAGNTTTATQALLVDITPPAIGITANRLTRDTTPVISGTTDLPAGSAITLTIDPNNDGNLSDALTYTLTVQAGGIWSVDTGAVAPTNRAFPGGGLTGTVGLTASGTDAAGNTATVSQPLTIDTSAPEVAITRSFGDTVRANNIIDGSENHAVTIGGTTTALANGTRLSITVTDGSQTIVDSATVNNNAWSIDPLDIRRLADGVITVTATYVDDSGNVVRDTATFLHDQTGPTATLSAAATTITGPTTVTVTFNEALAAGTLTLSDFGTSNGATLSNLATSDNRTFTFTLTPASAGFTSVWLPSSRATDLAGNQNGASNVLAFTVNGGPADTSAPTVVSILRATGAAALTNADSVTFRVTFSEAINTSTVQGTDFVAKLGGTTLSGVTLTATPVTGQAGVFDVTVTGTGIQNANGTLSLELLATSHGIADAASNALVITTAAESQSFTLDNIAPALAAANGAVVNGAVLTLSYDEALGTTTPAIGDYSIGTTGAALSITGVSVNTVTNRVTLTLDRAVMSTETITLSYTAANKVQDLAGNFAAPFTGRAVANSTPATDTSGPVIDLAPTDNATLNRTVTSASGAAVSLDDNANAATVVEASDAITQLRLTVAGLADGVSEKLLFGSTAVNANGTSLPALAGITVGGVSVNVTYAAGTFTVTRANFQALTAAEAQAIVRDIQYRNDATTVTTGNRTFTFAATDVHGNASASGAVATVSVTSATQPTNASPVGVNDTGGATEAGGAANATAGNNATGNVLTNDTDADTGQTLTVTAIRTGNTEGSGTTGTVGQALTGLYGTLTLNSDGTYTYVVDNSNATVQALAAGQTLTENFNYTVSDGTATDIAVLAITINGANDAPVLAAPAAITLSDTAGADTFANATGTLSATDPDSPTLTFGITGGTTGGTTQFGGITYDVSKAGTYGTLYLASGGTHAGKYVFVANATAVDARGTNASEEFTVTVSDGSLSDNKTLTVNVTAANDAPTIPTATVTRTIDEDTADTLSIADFAYADAEGTGIAAVRIVTVPTAGVLFIDANNNGIADTGEAVTAGQSIAKATFDSGQVKFRPANDANGTGYASLTYRVSDGAAESAGTGTLAWDVRPTPDVTAIDRAGGAAATTTAASVSFTVTFDQAVTGVDASDFALVTSGLTGAAITGVTGSGTTWTVTVSTGTGEGTLRLDLADDNSITNLAGRPLGGTGTLDGRFTGQSFTVNRLPALDLDGTVAPGNAVTFTEATHQGANDAAGVKIAPAATLSDLGTVDQVVVSLTNGKGDTGERLYFPVNHVLPTGLSVGVSQDGATLTITRTGAATTADVQAALRAVAYQNSSDTPDTTARSISVTATDNNGGQVAETVTVTVQASNDAPTVTATAANPGFVRGAATGSDLFGTVTVGTVESGQNLDRLTLTVSGLKDGAREVLSIDGTQVQLTHGTTATTATNGLSVTVAVDGNGVATITLSKTGGISATDMAALVDGLSYKHTGTALGDITGGQRTVTITSLRDTGGTADGGSDTATLGLASAVTVSTGNSSPAFTGLDGGATTAEQTAVRIDGNVTVRDAEMAALNGGNGNYAGASLTIARQGGANTDDGFGFDTAGALFTVDGTSLKAGGQTFATVGGTGGTLTISFTNGGTIPTQALVNDVLQRVTYRNGSDTPPAGITLAWGFSDSSGDPTASGTTAVNITPVNDAPTLTATANARIYTEDGAATGALFDVTALSTVEGADRIAELRLTVSNMANGADEVLSINGTDLGLAATTNPVSLGNGLSATVTLANGTATVTVTGSLTADAARTLLNGITYRNASQAPGTADRTVSLTLLQDDGGIAHGGQDSTQPTLSATVQVVAVNDAGGLSGNLTLAPIAEDPASNPGRTISQILSDSTVTLQDPDSGSSLSGLAITGNGADATTQGVWQYSTDSGTTWHAVPATVSDGAALALSSGTLLRFSPVANFNGTPGGLTVRALDNSYAGNFSSGATAATLDTRTNGGTTAVAATTRTLSTSVTPVNDAPTATIPTGITVVEDTATALTGISFADVDAASGTVTATFGVGSGTLSATGTGAVAVTGTGTGSLTLSGSLADINAFIAGGNLTFTTARDSTADVTLSVSLSDGGNTGSGGAKTSDSTVTLTVTPVNDAPTLAATARGLGFVRATDILLFKDAAASTIEAGQGLDRLVLAVAGVRDGAAEVLRISGTDLALTATTNPADLGNGLSATVTLNNGTATVTLSKAGGITPAAMAALVDSIAYRNGAAAGSVTAGDRVVTLTGLRDTGGTGNGGQDTAPLNLSSTVAVTNPTITIGTIAGDDVLNATERGTDLTISGTAAGVDGRTVTVTLNGKDYTGTVSNGTWSVTVPQGDVSVLSTGTTLTATARVSTPAGNGAEATRPVATDFTAPTLTIAAIATDDVVNAVEKGQPLAITGTATGADGQQVSVTLNGKTYSATVTNGIWSATVPQADVGALADNASLTVTASVSDTAGNAANQIRGITTDFAAPTVAVGTVAGDDVINAAEKNQPLTLSGTATGAEGRTVTVGFNGRTYTATVTNGAWSLQVPTGDLANLTSGTSLTVTADLSDAAGNPALQGTRTVTTSLGGASVAIGLVAGDDVINRAERGQDLALSGTATGLDGRQVTIGLNGRTYLATVANGTWTVTVPKADVGLLGDAASLTVTADATDSAGNPVVQGTRAVTTDLSAPALTIAAIAADDVVNAAERGSALAISGTATGADGRTVTVGLNGKTYTGTVSNGIWTVTVPQADVAALADNANLTVTADVADAAGNAAQQATRPISTDFTAPTLTIGAIAGDDRLDAAEKSQVLTIGGTASGAEGRIVTLSLNGKTYTAVVQGGTWSVTLPTTDVGALPDGASLTASATLSDAAGNPALQADRTLATNALPRLGAPDQTLTITDKQTATPFAQVTIADGETAEQLTVTLSLDDAARGGFTAASLTASGFTVQGNGAYRFTGTAAAAQAAIRQLVFQPTENRVPVGQGETTRFTLTVTDAAGATATVNAGAVTATSANDAPTRPGSVTDQTATEDSPFTYALPAGLFADVDLGDTLTLSATLANGQPLPAWLSFNPATRTFSGTPANGDVGTVQVRVTAADGSGATASATLALAVLNTNDAPVAVADAGQTFETTALVVSAAQGLLANDVDVDAGDSRAVAAVNGVAADVGRTITLASGALLRVNADGSYSYDPNNAFRALNAGETQTDRFTYTVKDAAGATSTAEVVITIGGQNNAPLTQADKALRVGEDSAPVGLSIDVPSDVDNQGLTVTVSGLPTTGTVTTLDGRAVSTGMRLTPQELAGLVFEPTKKFTGSAGQFRYVVSDGIDSVERFVEINVVPTQRISITSVTTAAAEGAAGSGTTYTFQVSRTGQPVGTVNILWLIEEGNGIDRMDFADGILPSGVVTLADGEASRLIIVTVRGDATVEADESFTVKLVGMTSQGIDPLPVYSNDQADAKIVDDDRDRAPPRVVSVEPPAAKTYFPGDVLELSLRFTEAVQVTGAPTLSITVGDTVRQAQYVSGNGSDRLTFRYVVQGTDVDRDGISIANQFTVATAGQITDQAGNGVVPGFALRSGSGAVLDLSKVLVNFVRGKSIDGYISGATVFADANRNGVLDAGEASSVTDAAGNYEIAGGDGPYVMLGGRDISTGVTFDGVYEAPPRATVINPLTTTVTGIAGLNGTDAAFDAAAVKLKAALGLDARLDLLTYDPILAATDPAATAADVANAVKAQEQAAKIANLIVQGSAVLMGAATGTLAAGETGRAVVTALGAAISALPANGTIDLANDATVTAILRDAAGRLAQIDMARVDAVAADAARVIAAANGKVAQVAAAGTDATASLTEIARVQTVAQGDAARALEAGTSGGSVAAAVNNFTGGSLSTAVSTASVGIVVPTRLSVVATDAVKAEGDSGTTAFTFQVQRTGGMAGSVSVNWAVGGSGGLDGADFGGTLPSGTVTFAEGETVKTITVLVSGDLSIEGDEGFTVTLSGATGGADLATRQAAGTILDNDPVNPTLVLPTGVAVLANTAAPIAGLSLLDADSGTVTVTLTPANGSVTLTGPAMIESVGGSTRLTGTVAAVNASLATLVFVGQTGQSAGSIRIQAGDGDAATPDTDRTLDIRIATAPENLLPIRPIVVAGYATEIIGLSVRDIDSPTLTVTLTPTNGTVDVTRFGDTTITRLDNGAVRITGSLAFVNSVLGSLEFTAIRGTDSATLRIDSADADGLTADDGDIIVIDVIHAPETTLPADVSVTAGNPSPVTGIVAYDKDSPRLAVTLSPTNGTIALTAIGGATITQVSDTAFRVTGNAADVNATLETLTFTGDGAFATGSLRVQTTDFDVLTPDRDTTIPVRILSGPLAALPTLAPVLPGATTPLAGLAIRDVDTPNLTVILTPTNGTLSIPALAGVTQVVGTDGRITLTGAWTAINTALNGASITTGTDGRPVTIRVQASDGDPATTDLDRVLNVPVVSAPVLVLPDSPTLPAGRTTPVPGITVADSDSPSLTVTLRPGAGSIALTATGGAGLSTAPDGTVTLTGSPAALNATLATLAFTAPTSGGGTSLSVTVSDGDSRTPDTSGTLTLAVAAGQPPEAGGDVTLTDPAGTATSIRQGTTPTAANVRLAPVVLRDPDGNTPTAIRILSVDGGSLTRADGSAITLGGAGTILTLTGGAVDLRFAPGGASDARITYVVVDPDIPGLNSAASTATVRVTPANTAPTAVADAGSVAANGLRTVTTAGGLLANDTDPDTGDTLRLTAVNGQATFVGQTITLASGARLLVNADGSYSYDPNGRYAALAAGQTATDSFTYTVTDSQGATSRATVTLTVTGANDAPVAQADTANAAANGRLTLTPAALLANDTDLDSGDTLRLSAIDGQVLVPGGTITLASGARITVGADGSLSYDPSGRFDGLAAGQTAFDRFTYTVADGSGATSTATVTLLVQGVNDAPVGIDDTRSLTEDAGITVAAGSGLLANDRDADSGDTLRVSAINGLAASVGQTITLPSGALLRVNADGSYSYDPNGRFDGLADGQTATDSFTYTVADAAGLTSTATMRLVIAGRNDAPVARDDAATVGEKDRLAVPALGVLANDTDADAGDSLRVTAVNGAAASVGQAITLPSGALLTLNADGSYNYDPNGRFDGLAAGQTATDSFTYAVTDRGGATAAGRVIITIRGANDAPAPSPDAATVREKGTLSLTATQGVLANDRDADAGESLSVAAVNGQSADVGRAITLPSGARLLVNADGSYAYDPAGRFDGLAEGQSATDSFTYAVRDAAGTLSTQTVTITILGENDRPVAGADTAQAAEDSRLATTAAAGLLSNDRDVDAGDALSVTAVNGQTSSVGQAITLASGARLTVNADGSYSYDPNGRFEGLAAGQSGSDSFTYTVTDRFGASTTQTVTVSIAGANDAPTLLRGIADQTVDQDAPLTFRLPAGTFGDVDAGDSLSFTATLADGSPLPAWLGFDPASQTFSGKPGNDQVGTLSVRVTARDGSGSTASGSFTLAIRDVNDTPTASLDRGALAQTDKQASSPFATVAVADVDRGEVLTATVSLSNQGGGGFTAASLVAAGFTVNPDGTATVRGTPAQVEAALCALVFQPQENRSAPGANDGVSASITIRDAAGATVQVARQVLVASVNDAPVAVGTATLPEGQAGGAYSATLPAGLFRDVDTGDSLRLTLANLPAGLAFDPATRTISGTLSSADAGSRTLTLVATDNAGATAQVSIPLSVRGLPQVPVPVVTAPAPAPAFTPFPAIFNTPVTAPNGTSVGGGTSLSSPTDYGFGANTYRLAGEDRGDTSIGRGIQGVITVVAEDNGGSGGNGGATLYIRIAEVPSRGVMAPDPATGINVYTLPDSTFVSNDPKAVVTAKAQSGQPLPAWLSFEPRTGTFRIVGEVPRGLTTFRVQVIAQTSDGAQKANVLVTLVLGDTTRKPTPVQAPADRPATPDRRADAEQAPTEAPPQREAAFLPAGAEPRDAQPSDAQPAEMPGKPPVTSLIRAASSGSLWQEGQALLDSLAGLFGAPDPLPPTDSAGPATPGSQDPDQKAA